MRNSFTQDTWDKYEATMNLASHLWDFGILWEDISSAQAPKDDPSLSLSFFGIHFPYCVLAQS